MSQGVITKRRASLGRVFAIVGIVCVVGCRTTGLRPSFLPHAGDTASDTASAGLAAGAGTSGKYADGLPPPSAAAIPSPVHTADASMKTAPPAIPPPVARTAQASPRTDTPLPVATYPTTPYPGMASAPVNPPIPGASPTTYPSSPPAPAVPANGSLVQEGAYGYESPAAGSYSPPSMGSQSSYSNEATTWGGGANSMSQPSDIAARQPPASVPYAAPGFATASPYEQMPELPPDMTAIAPQQVPGMPGLPGMQNDYENAAGTIYGDLPSGPAPLAAGPPPGSGLDPAAMSVGPASAVSQASYDSPNPNSHYQRTNDGGNSRKPWCPGSTTMLPGSLDSGMTNSGITNP